MTNDNAVVDLDEDEMVGSNGGTPITPTQGDNVSQEPTTNHTGIPTFLVYHDLQAQKSQKSKQIHSICIIFIFRDLRDGKYIIL